MASREEIIAAKDWFANLLPYDENDDAWKCLTRKYAPVIIDALTAAEEERDRALEGVYKISVCYFPNKKEIEATWENSEGSIVMVTFHVDDETGERLAEIVPCCVYHKAIASNTTETEGSDEQTD